MVSGKAAVFLDRDGVINNHGGYINSAEEFALLPGAAAAVRRLNEAGVPVVLVTNQGGVALGYLTKEELEAIHGRMNAQLAEGGAKLDAVYACLYHPKGTVPGLGRTSRCRKPQPGMLEAAARDHHLDLSRSYMVGDMTTDIVAGKNAGCRTVLVQTGQAGGDGQVEATPDLVATDVGDAVEIILSEMNGGSSPEA